MPEEKIAELEKRFLKKERAEALEAEKRRIENERLVVIGKEHFADAIKKHGKPVALILAVEHEDVSDLQTDYFDYRTSGLWYWHFQNTSGICFRKCAKQR